MSFSVKIVGFVLLCSSIIFSQELTREQKLQKIDELNSQIKILEIDIILPDANDLKQAQKNSFNVFRIMPREIYDGVFTIRGGAAYYSFTTKLHNYNNIPQIELTNNSLSVGFAGADYGFIADLEGIPLEEINKETKGVNFLINYKSPNNELLARSEFKKFIKNYETDGVNFKQSVSAIVGHSYILRAITYNQADISVAFKIHRKDTDGSLIIFWKLLEQFEKPMLTRSDETSQNQSDIKLQRKILKVLRAKGFHNVTVEVAIKPIILRGTVPKGKLAEVIFMTQKANGGKPIKNEITEH